MEKRKELVVSAIENGTVIDHIPADKVFQVIKILGLETIDKPVYFGTNLESKKYGTKGIIKITDKFFEAEEINKIALVAPTATFPMPKRIFSATTNLKMSYCVSRKWPRTRKSTSCQQ